MEFSFDVNYVLPYEVTILNGDYRILNQGQTARILYWIISLFDFNNNYVFFRASEKLTSIIDTMGEASYKVNKII
jgi:hypothetical protein